MEQTANFPCHTSDLCRRPGPLSTPSNPRVFALEEATGNTYKYGTDEPSWPDRGDMPQLRYVSFGYGHKKPKPSCALMIDARHLTDPYLDPALRDLDARDPRVQRAVLRTPGAQALLAILVTAGYQLLTQAADDETVTIAVGCGGGKHRAPVLAARAAAQMDHLDELRVLAVHQDLDEKLLPAGAGDAAA
jgi:hypothetical protein